MLGEETTWKISEIRNYTSNSKQLVVEVTRLPLTVTETSHSHEKQHQKHLTGRHDTPHKKTNKNTALKLSHYDSASNA